LVRMLDTVINVPNGFKDLFVSPFAAVATKGLEIHLPVINQSDDRQCNLFIEENAHHASYPVEVSEALRQLAAEVDGRMAHAQEAKR